MRGFVQRGIFNPKTRYRDSVLATVIKRDGDKITVKAPGYRGWKTIHIDRISFVRLESDEVESVAVANCEVEE